MKEYKNGNIEIVVFPVGNGTEITGFCCADFGLKYFEHQYPLSQGMTYNSYVITDEKTVVMDTVDSAVQELWREALTDFLTENGGRKPDYMVVQHLEPDHSAAISSFMADYPDCMIVCSASAARMLPRFTEGIDPERVIAVGEGEALQIGKRTLSFHMAPMVHWPEVMVTYDPQDRIVFSADAFGTFGTAEALSIAKGKSGNFSLEQSWRDEARRYYANICGKYGAQVEALLDKLSELDIDMICPLHGPVIAPAEFNPVPLYRLWSRWEADTDGVTLFVSTLHGHTLAAAREFAGMLSARGVKASLFDLTGADLSAAVGKAFASKAFVFLSSTYDGGLMPSMRELLARMKAKGVRNRLAATVENGSWAPLSARLIRKELQEMKGIEIAEPVVTIHTRLDDTSRAGLEELAESFAGQFLGTESF